MEEKRKLERIRVYYYLKVYDKKSGKDIGSIIDITMRGMRIISEIPFVTDNLYLFTIQLPHGYIYGESFDMEARNCWCQKKVKSKYFEAGFQFVNTKRYGVMIVKRLISDLKNNNLI